MTSFFLDMPSLLKQEDFKKQVMYGRSLCSSFRRAELEFYYYVYTQWRAHIIKYSLRSDIDRKFYVRCFLTMNSLSDNYFKDTEDILYREIKEEVENFVIGLLEEEKNREIRNYYVSPRRRNLMTNYFMKLLEVNQEKLACEKKQAQSWNDLMKVFGLYKSHTPTKPKPKDVEKVKETEEVKEKVKETEEETNNAEDDDGDEEYVQKEKDQESSEDEAGCKCSSCFLQMSFCFIDVKEDLTHEGEVDQEMVLNLVRFIFGNEDVTIDFKKEKKRIYPKKRVDDGLKKVDDGVKKLDDDVVKKLDDDVGQVSSSKSFGMKNIVLGLFR